jgi:hypothetical protein
MLSRGTLVIAAVLCITIVAHESGEEPIVLGRVSVARCRASCLAGLEGRSSEGGGGDYESCWNTCHLLGKTEISLCNLFYYLIINWFKHVVYMKTREMENISRGSTRTFGDFVTILTDRSMRDVTVERSRVIFTAIVITRKIVQCYCVHEM